MYTIFKGGCNNTLPPDYLMSRPTGLYCYLLLIVKSPAALEINNQKFTLRPTSVVIISPNTPYQYSGLNCEYKNDWLHFSCENNEFVTKFGCLFNHPIFLNNGSQFSQFFQHIIWENHYATEQFRSHNISMLLEVLLYKLLQEEETPKTYIYTPYISRLQKLRLDMLSKPYYNFTSGELAKMLSISPSYFQFLYKSYFGIPFKTDLINMRLEYAQNLILETTLPIGEIAIKCGYANEIHFYRQFKMKVGMTPREYRSSAQ